MALLPKPGGAGFRTVAKTPTLYRLWGIVRRSGVKAWELASAPSWDKARPGRSALEAGYERATWVEVARACGRHVGSLLWDFTKFFDTIVVPLLLEFGLDLEFPWVDLVLGLHMHSAPRRLQIIECVGFAILPLRSILPGCTLSIPFTRAYLRRKFEGLVRLHPRVSLSVYVDDVAQYCEGTYEEVEEGLSAAAVGLCVSRGNWVCKFLSSRCWLLRILR